MLMAGYLDAKMKNESEISCLKNKIVELNIKYYGGSCVAMIYIFLLYNKLSTMMKMNYSLICINSLLGCEKLLRNLGSLKIMLNILLQHFKKFAKMIIHKIIFKVFNSQIYPCNCLHSICTY